MELVICDTYLLYRPINVRTIDTKGWVVIDAGRQLVYGANCRKAKYIAVMLVPQGEEKQRSFFVDKGEFERAVRA